MKREWPTWLKFLLWILAALALTVAFVFYPLFQDIYIENDSDGLYSMAKKIYNKKMSAIYIIFILVLAIAFCSFIYRQFDKEKESYRQELRDMGISILKKYEELKDLDMKKILVEIMEKFANMHAPILAIQIYRYQEIAKKKVITVKVNYVDGYVKEKHDINGMIQQYYHMNKKLYKRYTNAVNKFFKDTNYIGPLLRFILDEARRVSNKSISELTRNDALSYSLLMDAYATLKSFYPDILDIILDKRKTDKLEEFLKERRLGIFRGILLGSFYTFYYEGKGSKQGRQYLTHPIVIRNVKHIVLITVDPELLAEREQANEQLKKYILEFENMLHTRFETKYNEGIGGEPQ
jgi:hypothetical protein